jgi:hypothetical protein
MVGQDNFLPLRRRDHPADSDRMVASRHAVYPLQRVVLLCSIMGCMTLAIWPKAPIPNWTPIPETSPANPPQPMDMEAGSPPSPPPVVSSRLATSPGA